MKKILFLLLFGLKLIPCSSAQIANEWYKNDTILTPKSAILMKQDFMFSTNSKGWQIGIGKLLKQKEIHVLKKSGIEKIRTKNRILYGNIAYYYQPKFQHNWSLTAEYTMSHAYQNGFYSEFSPFLGVSRTFLKIGRAHV